MIARLNHTQLMLYAAFSPWPCVGIPLVLNTWYFRDGLSQFDLIAWRVAYFASASATGCSRAGWDASRPFDIVVLLMITLCASRSATSATRAGGD